MPSGTASSAKIRRPGFARPFAVGWSLHNRSTQRAPCCVSSVPAGASPLFSLSSSTTRLRRGCPGRQGTGSSHQGLAVCYSLPLYNRQRGNHHEPWHLSKEELHSSPERRRALAAPAHLRSPAPELASHLRLATKPSSPRSQRKSQPTAELHRRSLSISPEKTRSKPAARRRLVTSAASRFW